MGQQQRLRARVPAHADDAASLPTTTFTGLMFESYRGSSNELEIIQQLGSQECGLLCVIAQFGNWLAIKVASHVRDAAD